VYLVGVISESTLLDGLVGGRQDYFENIGIFTYFDVK
jgi:hypothetical protein